MKDKLNLIKSIKEQREVADFEQSLQSNPLTDTQIRSLPAGVRLQAMDYVKQLKDGGLVVPDPIPTIKEFQKANPGAFVLTRSAQYQMTTEEYRPVRQAGLFQDTSKLVIYPDISDDQAVVHYKFIAKNGTEQSTGANMKMINVVYRTLDEKQSSMNYQLVVAADEYYQAAKTEITLLMANIESIKARQFNSQALN
jgi:hypothetical protein